MHGPRFTPEFKEEAVRQVVERDYSVSEVSERLAMSAHSIHKQVKAVKPHKTDQHAADLLTEKTDTLTLKPAQLRRTEEERDVLEKALSYFAKEFEKSTTSCLSIVVITV